MFRRSIVDLEDFKVLKDELSSVQEETSGPGTVVLIEQGMVGGDQTVVQHADFI